RATSATNGAARSTRVHRIAPVSVTSPLARPLVNATAPLARAGPWLAASSPATMNSTSGRCLLSSSPLSPRGMADVESTRASALARPASAHPCRPTSAVLGALDARDTARTGSPPGRRDHSYCPGVAAHRDPAVDHWA